VGLVCDVFERRAPGSVDLQLESAKRLQQELLELVDQDPAAYLAFLRAKPGSSARAASEANVGAIPLRIARTCHEVLELVGDMPRMSQKNHIAAARRSAYDPWCVSRNHSSAFRRPRYWVRLAREGHP
jgi:formiminotetrahydrofolate cyclodeaminase